MVLLILLTLVLLLWDMVFLLHCVLWALVLKSWPPGTLALFLVFLVITLLVLLALILLVALILAPHLPFLFFFLG